MLEAVILYVPGPGSKSLVKVNFPEINIAPVPDSTEIEVGI